MSNDVTKGSIKVFATTLVALLGASVSLGQQPRLSKQFEQGRIDAKRDIDHGIYRIRVVEGDDFGTFGPDFCHFPSQQEIYLSILEDKYHVDVKVDFIADVGDWDEVIDFANGYNEISRSAIKSKYGGEVFENAQKQAANDFQTKYGDQQRKCHEWNQEWQQALMSLPKKKP